MGFIQHQHQFVVLLFEPITGLFEHDVFQRTFEHVFQHAVVGDQHIRCAASVAVVVDPWLAARHEIVVPDVVHFVPHQQFPVFVARDEAVFCALIEEGLEAPIFVTLIGCFWHAFGRNQSLRHHSQVQSFRTCIRACFRIILQFGELPNIRCCRTALEDFWVLPPGLSCRHTALRIECDRCRSQTGRSDFLVGQIHHRRLDARLPWRGL